MKFESAEVNKLAPVASRDILRPFEIGDRITRRTDRTNVPAAYKYRLFI